MIKENDDQKAESLQRNYHTLKAHKKSINVAFNGSISLKVRIKHIQKYAH